MTEGEYLNVAGNTAALLGNIGGMFMSSSDNKKLLREQMRFNEKMFDAQKEYNWDMFNATNAYNSPSAQLSRIRQAGINPAMAMSNASPAEAQGGGVSPPSAPGANPMHVASFDPLANIGETLYNSEIRDKQLESMQIANERAREMQSFEKESHVFDLLKQSNDVEEGKWRNTDWSQRTLLNNLLFRDRVDQARLDTANKKADFDYKQLQSMSMRIQNRISQMNLENLPKEFAARLALLSAQRYAAMGQGASGFASAKASLALAAKTDAEAAGVRLSNQQASAIAGASMVAAIAEANAKTLRFENELAEEQDLQDFLYGSGTHQKAMRYVRQAMDYAVKPLRSIFK